MLSFEALAGTRLMLGVALLESLKGALAWKLLRLRQHAILPWLPRPTGRTLPYVGELIEQRGQVVIPPSGWGTSFRDLSRIGRGYRGLARLLLSLLACASAAEVVVDLRWPVALLALIYPGAFVRVVLAVATVGVATATILSGRCLVLLVVPPLAQARHSSEAACRSIHCVVVPVAAVLLATQVLPSS